MNLQQAMTTYGDLCLNVAYVYVYDWKIAENIVQEAFLAYANATHLKEDDEKRYLIHMTVHHSHQQLRKQKTFWSFKKQHVHTKNDTLLSVLQQLPLKYREVLLLYDYAELPISAISSILSCKNSIVEKRYTRGQALLNTVETEVPHEKF